MVLRGSGDVLTHRAVTPAPEANGRVRLASSRGRWVLAATVLGSAVASLTGTVVNVALPAIGSDLDVGTAGLQWVLNGYLLALASLILIGGTLGDRYGHRTVFVVGAVWFGVASVLCAVAPDIRWLVAFRVLQGVGAALLVPESLAIIESVFDPADRGRAIGQWSALGGIAAAVGPRSQQPGASWRGRCWARPARWVTDRRRRDERTGIARSTALP